MISRPIMGIITNKFRFMAEFYNKATKKKFHTNSKLTNIAVAKMDHIKHISKVQNVQREKRNFEKALFTSTRRPSHKIGDTHKYP